MHEAEREQPAERERPSAQHPQAQDVEQWLDPAGPQGLQEPAADNRRWQDERRAATKPIAGRIASRLVIPRTRRMAASTLRRTSGVFRTAIEGRATQKKGAMTHDCAPSM